VQQKNNENALRRAYLRTFGTEDGETVLKDLEARCGYNSVSHVASDPYETAFREGQRSVILAIHALNRGSGE
tara:strand:- start:672 stop:887 length:216 start_codon:yes stop_codon:yes gene_type:complete